MEPCVGNRFQASRGSDSLPAASSAVCSPAASPASGTGTTSTRRPSRPLVAMITAVAKRTITALKIKNLVVFDPGTTS
jgi:hypothetical protein